MWGLERARQHSTECCSRSSNGCEANTCPQLAIARLLHSPEERLQHGTGSQQMSGHLEVLPPLLQARAVPQQCSGRRL